MATNRVLLPVTILNGQSLSGAIALNQSNLTGILMPAAWTAAGMTFAVSSTLGGTYVPFNKADGTEYALTIGANVWQQIPIVDFMGVPFIKLRSGTLGVPVAQGADRIINLAFVNA